MVYTLAGVAILVLMVVLLMVLKPPRGQTAPRVSGSLEIAAAITITVGFTLGLLLAGSGFLPESATTSAISTPVKKK